MACFAMAMEGTVAFQPASSARTCPSRVPLSGVQSIRCASSFQVSLQSLGAGIIAMRNWSDENRVSMGSFGQSAVLQFSPSYSPVHSYMALKQDGRSMDFSNTVVCSSASGTASWDGAAASSWEDDAGIRAEARTVAGAVKVKKAVAGVDQSQLVDPWQLADADSRFADFYGVEIHFKVAHPSDVGSPPSTSSAPRQATADLSEVSRDIADSNNPPPAILLHGFGASLFSFERIMRPLSLLLRSHVLAFDRPAFGLTSRASYPFTKTAAGAKEKAAEKGNTSLLNPYSLGFSSAAVLSFIDLLKSRQAILVGHSAGCIVAANAYLEAPERVAAIIMLAPALVAPLVVKQFNEAVSEEAIEESQGGPKRTGFVGGLSTAWDAVVGVALALVGFIGCVLAGVTALVKSIFVTLLRTRLAAWVLRFIMNKGGRWIVRYAWYDPLKADDYVLDGYTKPLGCKDWDKALLEFVIGLASGPPGERSLGDRLTEVSCPVLVVTGDCDRLVPSWNAERLSKLFPKAQFKLIKNCGHLPHEEKVEETLGIIREFVGSLGRPVDEEIGIRTGLSPA